MSVSNEICRRSCSFRIIARLSFLWPLNRSVTRFLKPSCDTPAAAKDYLETHHIKPDHDCTVQKKLMVMEKLLTNKFGGKEPFLTRALLATGDATLIEGNTWDDTFRGVCNNTGENHLGKILMKIRKELFRQKEQIIHLLSLGNNNSAIAEALSVSERNLYEKMMAFKIQNKEFWIS